MKRKERKAKIFFLIFLIIWLGINLIGLTRFPFVHSDESWLSGLSRSMIDSGSLSATEDFFDLYERNPHAIKILFHLIQILFIKVFGYSIVSVRLVSLFFGAGSLGMMFLLLNSLGGTEFEKVRSRKLDSGLGEEFIMRKGLKGRAAVSRLVRETKPLESLTRLHRDAPGKARRSLLDSGKLFLRGTELQSLSICLLVATDVLFIYLSRFARQEICLLFVLISALFVLFQRKWSAVRRGIVSGILIGLAVGFHPNSFLIAWPVGIILGFDVIRKRRPLKELAFFVFVAGVLALVFAGISFYFNPDFIRDYRAYGEPLGILESTDVKILRVPRFYRQIFERVGGTYYLPEIRFQMLLFAGMLLVLPFLGKGLIPWIGFLGFNIGLVIIGKFSPPSILFLLPFYYLALFEFLEIFNRGKKKIFRKILWTALLLLNLIVSLSAIAEEKISFNHFTDIVNRIIPEDAVILGNLYYEYAAPEGQLYFWRNLEFLDESGIDIESYIRDRNIEYIVCGDELDFIYRNRPVWNVLYGNISHWYPDLLTFLDGNCVLAGDWDSPAYGNRIAAYRYQKNWNIKVYRVNSPDSIKE